MQAAKVTVTLKFLCRFIDKCCAPRYPAEMKLNLESNIGFKVVVSVMSAILTCSLCIQVSEAVSVSVNPTLGIDSTSCSTSSPCKTIVYAIQSRNADTVYLTAGHFKESGVVIKDSYPFVRIVGSNKSSVIDCSLSSSSGPAFFVANTSVSISGITFQHCANFNVLSGFGGAVSASGSNITVSECNFLNNSAQNGGAIGATSSSLTVSTCFFQNNTATCPNATSTDIACSAWGGAIGTIEAPSMVITGNIFRDNTVNLVVNSVNSASSQSVAGGGCVSSLHNLNVSASRVRIDGNIFQRCSVIMVGFNDDQDPPKTQGVQLGNAYGGAVSLYYGLNAISSLVVQNASSAFRSNECCDSGVINSVGVAGNAYGGCISVYVGAWTVNAWSDSSIGSLSVTNMQNDISNNVISNCSTQVFSASLNTVGRRNTYGGAISLYVGAYSYVERTDISSIVLDGRTTVANTSYTISNNTLTGCIAQSSGTGGGSSYGANSYGGGMSLYVGVYSYGGSLGSTSTVTGHTVVANTSYTISNNTLTGCSAQSSVSGGGPSYGANIFGGGMSLALGAYSYCYGGGSSIVVGQTMVSSTSYTISSNVMTNCSAASLVTDGGSSYGANTYGGCVSLNVGAYSYSYGGGFGVGGSSVTGQTTVNNTGYTIISNILTGCNSLSSTIGSSDQASCYGGAMSVIHKSLLYPANVSSVVHVIGVSVVMHVIDCHFWNCTSTTASQTCASGSSNSAGGAFFLSVPSLDVDFNSSTFANSRSVVNCAAFSSSTHSLGGGLSVLQAGNINIKSTDFTNCSAQGVLQANNVFVGGGGLHVQESNFLSLHNCSMSKCGIFRAFSSFLQSGGGGLGVQNVFSVQIRGSSFRDNFDSSATGSIFLQHLKHNSTMNVVFDRSVVFVSPSSAPALNISCGSQCSLLQQQRIRIDIQNSHFSAFSGTATLFDSSAILSVPTWSELRATDSFLICDFKSVDNIALLADTTQEHASLSCKPCANPSDYALTSSTLSLANFRNVSNLGQGQCRDTASSIIRQCPYGVRFCSTIVNVSVGFWATFSADGRLSVAIRCPQNYCGCKNTKRFNGTSCQLEPPFALGYQSDLSISDNLCNNNRSGVLCGGCKKGFTQSLDGYSCISDDMCLRNVGWSWAGTIVGFILYSIYIAISSLRASEMGLVKCLLFYGQMSTFAQLSTPLGATGPSSLWLARVLQFESITSWFSEACYGPGIGAYDFTAMQLCGPAIVLVFALCFSLFLKNAQAVMQRCNIVVGVSVLATLSNVILLIFSSVSTVVFKLITCSTITIDDSSEYVVYIDGTVKCYDERWKGLIAIVVFLCLFPFCFAAALRSKWLPPTVHVAVCSAYTESCFYWGAVTLMFRLAMSIVFSTIRDFPSTAALIHCFLCIAILVLLVYQQPYRHKSTYVFDILCHVTLTVQFALVAVGTVSESLGFLPNDKNLYFPSLSRAAQANLYLRYIPFIAGTMLWLHLHCMSNSEKASLVCRFLKDCSVACFQRYRSRQSKSRQVREALL